MRESKLFIAVASVLALAACGGGSGGGGTPHTTPTATPSTPSVGGTFSSGIYTNTESNSAVTQMKTQVVVDSGGNVITPSIARGGSIRSGSIQDTVGNSYKIYDLEDVKFTVADQTINDPNPAFLKLGLTEDGAINNITLSSGGVESNLARDGATNQFRGPIFEYTNDSNDRAMYRMIDGTEFGEDLTSIEGFTASLNGDGKATMETLNKIATAKGLSGGHWTYIDERMDVTTNKHITSGNANAKVLQYSDFGHFNPVYRSKHKNLDADVLSAIREYGSDIENALATENETEFNNLLAAHSDLNRHNPDNEEEEWDKYHDNEEFAAELGSQDYQLFAGGYAIGADGNPVSGGSFEAPRNTTFTGTAIGRVYTSVHADVNGTETEYKTAVFDQYGIDYSEGVEKVHDIAKTFTDSNAELTIDNAGNQTLTMNFPDFYTVTATKTVGGVEDVAISNAENVSVANKPYMRTDDVAFPTYNSETHRVTSNGTTGDAATLFKPGYYGVGSASEAAGVVRYAEDTTGITVTNTTDPEHPVSKTFNREFEFQGAYGLQKD